VTRFRVEFDGIVVRQDTGERVTDPDEIQQILDRILLQLTKMSAIDPILNANADLGQVMVSVCIEEESEVFMASMAGFTQIRTAVHAAGIGTPGWKVEWIRTTTESPEAIAA
jgi:hypothetical protein